MTKLTIFTPTYNRAYMLGKLFASLKNQTNFDFVWLIIDDGSTDNTEEVVKNWQKEDLPFKIGYVKKENGGKNTAIDLSNQICKTDYIVCIDSDDYLTNDAVEKIYKEIKLVDKNDSICGIVSRRVKPDGKPFKENWTGEEYKALNFYDLAPKYGYDADTCLVFKTNIIKRFSFPKIPTERFVTESVFYQQFLYDYKMLASAHLYYVAEYMPDGYTSQGMKLFFKNPKGYLYSLKQDLYYARKNKGSLKSKLGLATSYYAWKKVNKIKDDFPNVYKLPMLYKIFGVLLSPIKIAKFKRIK